MDPVASDSQSQLKPLCPNKWGHTVLWLGEALRGTCIMHVWAIGRAVGVTGLCLLQQGCVSNWFQWSKEPLKQFNSCAWMNYFSPLSCPLHCLLFVKVYSYGWIQPGRAENQINLVSTLTFSMLCFWVLIFSLFPLLRQALLEVSHTWTSFCYESGANVFFCLSLVQKHLLSSRSGPGCFFIWSFPLPFQPQRPFQGFLQKTFGRRWGLTTIGAVERQFMDLQ